ncbi:hypothetical protein GC020_06615, partial [Campylobacter hepaticus]|nr:hypothetical protein [Campylobacter hepaticus]
MKKIILLFFNLYILSFANTYEKFNDFAYEKKSNKNFKIQELQLVTFFKNKQNCLEFLIEKDQIR